MTKPMAVRVAGDTQPRSMLSFTKKMMPRNKASPPTQAKSFAPMNCSRLMPGCGLATGLGLSDGLKPELRTGSGAFATGSGGGTDASITGSGSTTSALTDSSGTTVGSMVAFGSRLGASATWGALLPASSRSRRFWSRAFASRNTPISRSSASALLLAVLALTSAMIGRMNTAPATSRRMRMISSIVPRSLSGLAGNGN